MNVGVYCIFRISGGSQVGGNLPLLNGVLPPNKDALDPPEGNLPGCHCRNRSWWDGSTRNGKVKETEIRFSVYLGYSILTTEKAR